MNLLTSLHSSEVRNTGKRNVEGFIGEGTEVHSHMIFLNKEENAPSGKLGAFAITFTFNGNVLGVITNTHALDDTDEIFGLTDTIQYPGLPGSPNKGNFFKRGLGAQDGDPDFVQWDPANPNQLTVRMQVTQPGDWIRVITAVPEPSMLLPIALGSLGMFVAARRQKN